LTPVRLRVVTGATVSGAIVAWGVCVGIGVPDCGVGVSVVVAGFGVGVTEGAAVRVRFTEFDRCPHLSPA
jgi:hypothetical protein